MNTAGSLGQIAVLIIQLHQSIKTFGREVGNRMKCRQVKAKVGGVIADERSLLIIAEGWDITSPA